MQATFSDAALVVLGHGSTINKESGATVFQHAAALRQRQLFSEVREGFWKQEPHIQDVLAQIEEPRILIVPLFMSEGYFSREVIPEALGFPTTPQGQVLAQSRGSQRLLYSQPIGTHPAITQVVIARAREVLDRFPFPRAPESNEVTLFIAGHGTEQNENSRVAIEQQAEVLRAENIYAAVRAIFLDEEPRIGSCFELAQTRNIVVVPFFVSDGMHVHEDIPVLLGEPERLVNERLDSGQATWRNPTEKRGKLVWYAGSVGTHPAIADLIVERAREATGTAALGETQPGQTGTTA